MPGMLRAFVAVEMPGPVRKALEEIQSMSAEDLGKALGGVTVLDGVVNARPKTRALFDQYLRDHPAPEACEYYMCGPPVMTSAVLGMLDGLGVDENHILMDDFGP